jgi:5-methylcytosine-specific restriction endonuclease McrBC GTP-binding regulatory subunit McrB
VQDKNSKSGKYFFTLKLKGDKLVISDKAKWNNAKELGQLDRDGNYKVEQKPCEIESQLTLRLKEQGESIMNVVPKKDTKEVE